MDFEAEIRKIHDTLVVVGEIEARMAAVQQQQSAVQKQQAEGLAAHERRMNHIDERLAEIADKLDGLIGFMDNFIRNRPESGD
jgi:3-methyladenine DNA glycosylase/8-oxoguanine DNA glycosylase